MDPKWRFSRPNPVEIWETRSSELPVSATNPTDILLRVFTVLTPSLRWVYKPLRAAL
jgi:hypothetical protein